MALYIISGDFSLSTSTFFSFFSVYISRVNMNFLLCVLASHVLQGWYATTKKKTGKEKLYVVFWTDDVKRKKKNDKQTKKKKYVEEKQFKLKEITNEFTQKVN